MARRRRTPKQKAASRANLEKARAARSSKAKGGFTQSATSAAKKEAAHRKSVTKIMQSSNSLTGKKTRQKPSGTARVRRTKSGIVMNEFGMALN